MEMEMMKTETINKEIIILVADDDPDDRLMIKDSFEETGMRNPVHFVHDGEELLDYLMRRGAYTSLTNVRLPGLILLDLNMPKKDGREALKEIKGNPLLRQIPVVVFTTSKAEEDICRSYELGVNSFICKPLSYDVLVKTVKSLIKYWLETVQLPFSP
jgi:two-component system, response regulator